MSYSDRLPFVEPLCYVHPGKALDAPRRDCPRITHFKVLEGIVRVSPRDLPAAHLRAYIMRAAGYTSGQAADKTGTSADTVKAHVKRVMQTRGVTNMREAITDSFESGEFTVLEPIAHEVHLKDYHVDTFELLAHGLTTATVARRLMIAEDTVKSRATKIMQEMHGAPNMVAATLRGYMIGTLSPETFRDTSAA